MACKATWQRHKDPHESLRGADVARMCGRATRIHTDARVAPTWHERIRMADDGPTCIVGSGIGAITHLRYIAPPFIRMFSGFFSRVGLIYLLSFQDTWRNVGTLNQSR